MKRVRPDKLRRLTTAEPEGERGERITDPAQRSDAELHERLRRIRRYRSADDAEEAAILAECDQRRSWAEDGHVDGAAWLAHETGISRVEARERVRVAHRLQGLPAVAGALADGTVSYSKVRSMVRAARDDDSGQLEADEAELLGQAEYLGAEDFGNLMRTWQLERVPASGAADAEAAHQARRVSLHRTFGRRWSLRGLLDDEAGATLQKALREIERELLDAEAAATPQRGQLERSFEQRRADALVELARRAAQASGTTQTHLDIVATEGRYEHLDGTPVPAEAAERLACDVQVRRVVRSDDGAILSFGANRRLPSPAQRQAVILRDRHCTFPGCDRPGAWCDAHHITHWMAGGPTDLDNLTLVCGHHHRLVHEGGFTCHRSAGGLEWRRPDGRVLERRGRDPGTGMEAVRHLG